MQECRTYEKFRALGRKCIDKWIGDGEVAYATWFEETYFNSPWDGWFVGAAGNVSGVLPNQNAIESFHLTIKKAIPNKRASTACILNDSFPVLLLLVGEEFRGSDIAGKAFHHYAHGKYGPFILYIRGDLTNVLYI